MVIDGIKGAGAMLANQQDHRNQMDIANVEHAHKARATVEAAQKTAKEYLTFLRKNPGVALQYAVYLFGAYFTIKHLVPFIIDQYKIPSVLEETSLISTKQRLYDFMLGRVALDKDMREIILESHLAERFEETAISLRNAMKHGSYLPHILLWGEPGTGKTSMAMRMARSCGMDYAYFSAASLLQLDEELALQKIRELFTYAQYSSKKLMIVIDEVDGLFRKRSQQAESKVRALMTQVLANMGTPSRDFMVVALTNRPEDLDEAFLSRFDYRIHLGVPNPEELRKILELYINNYLVKAQHLQLRRSLWQRIRGKESEKKYLKMGDDVFSDEVLTNMVQQLDGFVGRDIEKMVRQIADSAYATDKCEIAPELVEKILQRKIAEKRDQDEGFSRAA